MAYTSTNVPEGRVLSDGMKWFIVIAGAVMMLLMALSIIVSSWPPRAPDDTSDKVASYSKCLYNSHNTSGDTLTDLQIITCKSLTGQK